MIPTFEDVEAAYRFLARRHGVSGEMHEPGVRVVLELARSLAASPEDDPAAVFYALSRYPRALGGLGRAVPAMIALNLARATGHPVRATAAELRAFFVPLEPAEASRWVDGRRLSWSEESGGDYSSHSITLRADGTGSQSWTTVREYIDYGMGNESSNDTFSWWSQDGKLVVDGTPWDVVTTPNYRLVKMMDVVFMRRTDLPSRASHELSQD